jgi:very-short-patch-repair endonuclease
MDKNKIYKNGELLDIAKILRRNMTRQEKRLWYDFLRHYPEKIYKQRVVDNFVADFYCHRARLVIELDGAQHYMPEVRSYDENRTKVLEKYGLQVLRFSNKDVDIKFEGVCHVIDKTIKERIAALEK